jgi:hypothetical protein
MLNLRTEQGQVRPSGSILEISSLTNRGNELSNKISVRLIVSGYECSASEVTRALGVEPTRSWNQGDQVVGTKKHYGESGWRLDSSLSSDASIDQQLRELLNSISERIEFVRSLPGSIEVDFSCVIYAREYVPEIFFSADIIRRIADIGAAIDIDLYCLMNDI